MGDWNKRRGAWLDRHPLTGSAIFAAGFGVILVPSAVAAGQAWLWIVDAAIIGVVFLGTFLFWKSRLRAGARRGLLQ